MFNKLLAASVVEIEELQYLLMDKYYICNHCLFQHFYALLSLVELNSYDAIYTVIVFQIMSELVYLANVNFSDGGLILNHISE